MRRAGAVLWLALAIVQVIPAVTPDAESARRHAEVFRNTYPRPEGSDGESAAVEYLTRSLDQIGVRFVTEDFASLTDGHSFSRIIDISIPGESQETFMILVPLGHGESAGPDEDGSASLAAALALIEAAAVTPARLSIRVVILGAEHGQPPYPLGTRLLARDLFPDTDSAAIYLEANGSGIVIETGGGGNVAPSWLAESTTNAARDVGLVPVLRAGLNQLHRLGLSRAAGPLVVLLEAGVPAVYVRSEPDQFAPASVADTAADLAAFLGRLATEFEIDIPGEWDRHYLYFNLGTGQFVIPETTYLIVLVSVILGALLYALIARDQLSRYLKTIAKNFWNLPVLFLLIFLFLSGATLLIELFLILRRFPTLWQGNPMAYVALKITVSLFLFSLAAQLLRRLPLSKNGSFYSASALFVLFIDIILFTVLNLSFGYYFVWAFVLSFVFSVVRNRYLKLAALIAAPLFMVLSAIQVLSVPELRATQTVLLSQQGNLFLSFITLPFLLMMLRLDFLIRHPVAGKRSFTLRAMTVSSAILTVGLVVFVLLDPPFDPTNPQPVTVTERIDYESFTRVVQVSSTAPLGEFELQIAGNTELVSTGLREWDTGIVRVPDVLSVRLSTADFLDRNQSRLTVDSDLELETVEIRLTSEEPMTIYDVDFPYYLAADRLSATVYVGRRPGLPLLVSFTTASDTEPGIEVVATSSSHPEELVFQKAMTEVRTILVARSVLLP